MRRDHTPRASRSNEQQSPGVTPVMTAENLKRNEGMTEEYTGERDELTGGVSRKHPGTNKSKKKSKKGGSHPQ